jgi:hypothetical protein
MRIGSLQFLTWATIVAAIACAVWLATLAPLRPFGAAHQDASIGAMVDVSMSDSPPAAGAAASAAAASQAASF